MNKTNLFRSVPATYRPLPFWSWNDRLEPEELRRQIRLMHQAGLGGFFMHARGGLLTEYLGDEWMECVKACLDEAGKLGMEAWLYDENGWPSGFGGGVVNGRGEEFQQKSLGWEWIEAGNYVPDAHSLAFYSRDGELLGRSLPSGFSGEVLHVFVRINPFYVDNLDPRVVREFINCTHEKYVRSIPPDLLKNLRGIFCDEPQLVRNGIPWSPVLEAEYRRAYDRELLPELPSLFRELPGYRAVRVRFWQLVTELFSVNFLKRIHDWCAVHNWLLTGHHVLEETCQMQLPTNGAIMPQYRYYDMPGVDKLGWLEEPVAAAQIQVVSVAMQCGRKQILTESFAGTGWNFNFVGMRWLYQLQLARGVNRLCQHLQGYTLRGLRKRDYPASFFYHQPWWDDYVKLNDYFSFAGMVLAENPSPTEILVMHPISSAWIYYNGDWTNPDLDFYTRSLNRLSECLDQALLAYHYADEQMVRDMGRVENSRLAIGKMSYSLVILPMCANFSAPMVRLLREFAAVGGTILTVRNQLEPETLLLDGEPMPEEPRIFFRNLPSFDSESAAAAYAAECFPRRVRISENGVPATQMLCAERRISDLNGRSGRFYLIVSRQVRNPSCVRISVPDSGRTVEIIDELTGEFHSLAVVTRRGGMIEFDWYFAPGDSIMLVVSDAEDSTVPLRNPDPSQIRILKDIPLDFTVTNATENILTLDRCRFRVDDGPWQSDDVIQLQTYLTRLKRECDVELEYRFDLDDDFPLDTGIALVTETPTQYRFALNGFDFSGSDAGEFRDSAFRRVPLPSVLRRGENILNMRMHYIQRPEFYRQLENAKLFETEYNKLTYDSELESVYLIGDFSVRHRGLREELNRNAVRFCGDFSLGASLSGTRVNGSELPEAGLPFFAGKICLSCDIEVTEREARRISAIRFGFFGANSCRVRLNGEDLGARFWEPCIIDAAGKFHAGNNVLELELTTSLRNMLGPHHLEAGESSWVGTVHFNRAENAVGRMPPAYNSGYCMVKWGLSHLELTI